MDIRKKAALITALLISIATFAQTGDSEFQVKSFRKLDSDMDARITHPMMDQNNKKAALIKVVTSVPGFDFDVGIMGVIEVKKSIGELWVYVPENIKAITIRHPEFGVIRNYRFDIPIESASVYELLLQTPVKEQEKIVVVKDSIVYVTLPAEERTAKPKPGKAWNYDINIVPFFEMPLSDGIMSFGLISAYNWKRFGVTGRLAYYGNSGYTRFGATLGGTVKCGKRVRFCAGAGYGHLKSMGESGYSGTMFSKGLEVNTGAFLNFGIVSVYLGASSIQFKSFYGDVGIGIRLKSKTDKKK